jgi:hypothetical protein
MFGVLPAWGFYVRHGENIRLENVTLRAQSADYRPALVADDVRHLTLDRFQVKSSGSEPVIILRDVQGATLTNTSAPPSPIPFIKTLGNTPNLPGPLKQINQHVQHP